MSARVRGQAQLCRSLESMQNVSLHLPLPQGLESIMLIEERLQKLAQYSRHSITQTRAHFPAKCTANPASLIHTSFRAPSDDSLSLEWSNASPLLLSVSKHTQLKCYLFLEACCDLLDDLLSWFSVLWSHSVCDSLGQCFSNFNMHRSHLGIELKLRFWFISSGMGLRILVSNKFTCDVICCSVAWIMFCLMGGFISAPPGSPHMILCVCVCVYACVLVTQLCLFITPWTVTYQTPLSMEFSKQEYWSGLLFPPPEDLPKPRDQTCISYIAIRFFNV